ncbi:AbrB family transcriptional regulator [Pseudomonas sp. S2_F03]
MKTLLYLLIAAGVGTALQHAGIPHGLLLGSILATAVIASRFRFSPTVRFSLGYVQLVLGIATGLMFTAWDSQTVAAMLPSLGLMLLCLVVQSTVAGFSLLKVAGWNRKDTLLAVYPGALAAVFDLLESERASSKVIVVHLVRLLSITLLVSFCIPGQTHLAIAQSSPLDMSMALTLLSLIAMCLLLGRLLLNVGVPAPFMLTAIVLTGVYVKLGYLHGFQMPAWSVDSAAVLLGVLIGSKFKDISLAQLWHHRPRRTDVRRLDVADRRGVRRGGGSGAGQRPLVVVAGVHAGRCRDHRHRRLQWRAERRVHPHSPPDAHGRVALRPRIDRAGPALAGRCLIRGRRKGLSGRDRGQCTNQNGQHQKSTEEECHLAHWGLLNCEVAACLHSEPATERITDSDSSEKYGSDLILQTKSPAPLTWTGFLLHQSPLTDR